MRSLRYSPLLLAGTVLGLALTYLAPVALALFATGCAQLLGILAWLADGGRLPADACGSTALSPAVGRWRCRPSPRSIWRSRSIPPISMRAGAAACGRAAPKPTFRNCDDATPMRHCGRARDTGTRISRSRPGSSIRAIASAILAFYNFVRTADDIADHADAAAGRKARAARSARCRPRSARTASDAVAVRLRAALAERDLSPQHAQDLLAAFRLDVTKLRYRDWDDLIGYCSLSAMPVGRFVLDVHGESRAIWPANDALCAALQIINHLQDCSEDYRNLDRVYVPLDALAASGRRRRGARRAARVAGAARCLHRLAERTERLLRESDVFAAADRRLAACARSLRHQHAGASADAHPDGARSAERARASRHARRRRPDARSALLQRRVAAPRPAACRRDAQAAGCVSERARTPAAAARLRQLVLHRRCASCRARSARRCSKSIRSAAPSTISPTIRARASARRAQLAAMARATSTRSIAAQPPPQLAGLAQAVRDFDLAARGFHRHHRRHGDGCRRRHPRARSRRRSIFIATASPARSAGCRCACSAWSATPALRSRIISAARLQLTNILRDLDEDAALGRLYLPREALREPASSATDPRDGAGASGARRRPARRRRAGAQSISRRPTRSWRAIRAACVRAPRIMGEAYRHHPRPAGRARLCAAARAGAPAASAALLDRAAQCSCDGRAPFTSSAPALPACPPRCGSPRAASASSCTRRPPSPAAAAAPITTPRSA